MQAPDLPGQRGHVTGHILGVQHPADQVRFARRHPCQRGCHRFGPCRVVAAIKPKLDLRGQIDQRSPAQALHPGRPDGTGHGSLAAGFVPAKPAQRRNGSARVLHLMRTGQVWQGKVQKPAFVLKDQPPAIFGHGPMLAKSQNRRPHPRGPGLDHGKAFVGLRPQDHRHAALDDPGLFPGNRGHRIAKKGLMVQTDRGDDRQARGFDHVRCIQPSAKTHLQERPVGLNAREGKKGRAGGDLEEGDLVRSVRGHAFIQKGGQRGLADQVPRQADAFVKTGKMRRGIGVNPVAARPLRWGFQPGPDHRLSAALAVGPRNVDHRRNAALGVAKHGKQTLDAAQGQVDDLGMQRHHPLKDDIRRNTHALASAEAGSDRAASAGAGRSPLIAGGRPVSMRTSVTNSSRISLRWTTRSSIP